MAAELRDINTCLMTANKYGKWTEAQRKPKNLKSKIQYKKPNNTIAYNMLLAAITQEKKAGFDQTSIEKMIIITHIHPNIIKKMFMKFNRDGILSQAINQKPTDFEWIASTYQILLK